MRSRSNLDVHVLQRNDSQPILEHVHRFTMWDNNKALDQICKHLDLFDSNSAMAEEDNESQPQYPSEEDTDVFAKFAELAKNQAT